MWVDSSQSTASSVFSQFGASSLSHQVEVVEFYVPPPKPYEYLWESGPWVSRSNVSGGDVLENEDGRKFAEKVIEMLSPILKLADNWDGRGARQVSQDSIKRALETVLMVRIASPEIPYFVPTSAGGIQLEWHLRNLDIEIELTSNGRFDFFLEKGDELSEWDGDYNIDKSRMIRQVWSALSEQV